MLRKDCGVTTQVVRTVCTVCETAGIRPIAIPWTSNIRPGQWIVQLVFETVARRDAGPEPTWTYSRRVSNTNCTIHVGKNDDLRVLIADA
jgi:hypothetical protein